MTGDSIDIQLNGVDFGGGVIRGRAEVLTVDSTREDRLRGQTIELIASQDTMRKIIVSVQASSLYHIKDQETGEEGINSVEGDRIEMTFEQGELERIKVTSLPGQSSGIYKPGDKKKMSSSREKSDNKEGKH